MADGISGNLPANIELPGYVSLRIIHHFLIEGRQVVIQYKHGAIHIQR